MERNIRFFSTFSGVGGFELGIQAAIPGAECVGFSEINPHSSNVLRYRFKGVKNYGDITKIKPEELPDFDILCGGFPCQAFSIAGKRMGFKDTRGTLFYELARLAKSKRPSILFFENVKGLLSHEEGRTLSTILQAMDELGYDAEWQLLNSKHFGVPQNRERIFIIGYIRGKPRQQVFPINGATGKHNEKGKGEENIHGALTIGLGRQGSSGEYINSLKKIQKANKLKEVTQPGTSQWDRVYDAEGVASTLTCTGAEKGLYQVKEQLEQGKPRWGDHYKTGDDISPTLMAIGKTDVANVIVHSLQTRSKDRPSLKKNPKADGSGHISKEEETYCLDTGSTQAVEIGTRIRRLTPIECERLQGFPDNWTKYGITEAGKTIEISDNQRYAMMGNAVTVNVIKAIAERLHIEEI